MKKIENGLLIIGVVLGTVLLFAVPIWYHFWAPCSIHRRLDTSYNLPARCQQ